VLADRQRAGQVRTSFQLPVVLKPRSSYNSATPELKNYVRKIYRWDDFDVNLDELLVDGTVAVQENFIGDGVGVEVLVHAGEPLMVFQHVRLHEPLYGGGSSYRKSVPLEPELHEAAVRLLRKLGYEGVAMVEFKVDPRSGQWVFIELNGRFWGSLPLALAAGADFPLALFLLMVEGKKPAPRDYRIGISCRNWHADLRWQYENLRADRSDRTVCSRPLSTVVLETFKSVLTLKESSDTFVWDDPLPAVAELKRIAAETCGGLLRKGKRIYLDSRAVRRRLERRARRALRQSNTILFVCKGNLCRSPFAEHLARKVLSPDINVLSAGYAAYSGRKAPEAAIALAEAWGVDLSTHRSEALDPSLVMSADAIFVFDDESTEVLAARYPRAKDRIQFLGALNRRGPLRISDPWGRAPSAFEDVYHQIADALLNDRPLPLSRLSSCARPTPTSSCAPI
jgi:protein-tyrosine-phosphatase